MVKQNTQLKHNSHVHGSYRNSWEWQVHQRPEM